MYCTTCRAIILFAFVVQAHTSDLAANQTGDSQGALDELVDKLFLKALNLFSGHSTDLDTTALGKPSDFASPSANLRLGKPRHFAIPRVNRRPLQVHSAFLLRDSSSPWSDLTRSRPQFHKQVMRASTQERNVMDSVAPAKSAVQTMHSALPEKSNIDTLKRELLTMSAALDRGQAYNPTSGEYYANRMKVARNIIESILSQAPPLPTDLSAIDGEWELVFSTVKNGIFRSSPFFLAVQKALGSREVSDLAFKIHELQTHQFGLSKVGRVAQYISSAEGLLYSEFDTSLLSLTTVPLIGVDKLLPTFGGRVVTVSDVKLVGDRLEMEVQYTEGREVPGLPGLPGLPPGVPSPFQNRRVPVNDIWRRLPWNNGRAPTCSMQLRYVDEDMRIVADDDGEFFVYMRPVDPHGVRSLQHNPEKEGRPKGPPELPVVQNALDFIRYGGMSDMSIAMGKQYGAIAVARNNDRDFFFLNDPELVKQVTVTQSQAFYNRLGASPQTESNATGIVSAAKADHMRYRALANPFFLNKKLLEKYTSIVDRETNAVMATWRLGSEVDIQPLFKRVTLSVISKIAFTEFQSDKDQTISVIRELLDVSGDLQRERQVSALLTRLGEPVDKLTASLPLDLPKIADVVAPPSLDRMRDLGAQLRATESRIINARREEFEASHQTGAVRENSSSSTMPNDLLSVLISSKDDTTRPLKDGEIQTIVREIIIAGSDTTASSISATLFLLARDLSRQRRVLRELDDVVGTNSSQPITSKDVERLEYLRLCIKEAMRLYPAADVIFRTAGETASVGEYTIPKGAGVIMSPVSLGRNEEQWGFDADRFRPERFEELGADGQHRFPKHQFAWLPFGAGPRGCIGGRLAMMEATAACATVLKQWGLKATRDAELKPRYSVTVEFDDGVFVKVVPREEVLNMNAA